MRVWKWALALALALVAQAAAAKCNRDLPVGSQLLARKTITAWIEQGREQDGYQGCTFGRVLVFGDRTGVACTSFNFQFAFRPQAEIWAVGGGGWLLCVDGNEMDVQPAR